MTYNYCLVKLVRTFLLGITFTVNYYLMRHFLFGKDLYQNSKSQISPILSYYDFFQVGFSIKLMLIFFNKNFTHVLPAIFPRDSRRNSFCTRLSLAMAFATRDSRVLYTTRVCYFIWKKNNIFNKSWWVLLLQFSLANPELRNYYNRKKVFRIIVKSQKN